MLFCVCLPHTAVFALIGAVDLGLIYPVVRISKGRHSCTTKVVRENVRDQDEEAAQGEKIAPSSTVSDKATDTEKVVVVAKDMQYIFILVPILCVCMALLCISMALGIEVY